MVFPNQTVGLAQIPLFHGTWLIANMICHPISSFAWLPWGSNMFQSSVECFTRRHLGNFFFECQTGGEVPALLRPFNFASRTCRDCHQHLAHPFRRSRGVLSAPWFSNDMAHICCTYMVHCTLSCMPYNVPVSFRHSYRRILYLHNRRTCSIDIVWVVIIAYIW